MIARVLVGCEGWGSSDQRADMRAGLGQGAAALGVVERAEEGVGQGDRADIGGVRVGRDGRVDPEAERELHVLPGGKDLFIEAETGGLVEVSGRLVRGDSVGGDSGDGDGIKVATVVEGEMVLAEGDLQLALLGQEAPGQRRVGVGIEADGIVEFEVNFTGRVDKANAVKSFLDPQIRNAVETDFKASYSLAFKQPLSLKDSSADAFSKKLTQYGGGEAFVEAVAGKV